MFSRATVFPRTLSIIALTRFMGNKHRIHEKVITVPEKPLFLALPYLGPLSLLTKTKLRNSPKGILNCCKLQIV